MSAPEWQSRAACVGRPDLFLAGRGQSDKVDQARRICRAECPVVLDCLEWAMTHESGSKNYRAGVMGGLAPDERARLAQTRSERAEAVP